MALAKTFGELKASGWKSRSVRDELRQNLLKALESGKPLFEGIVGYDDTVLPQLQNALLSRHHLILLGLRGQAKTRLLRGLVRFLDEAIPMIEGSPLNEDPFHPVLASSKARVEKEGERLPIAWLPREARYHEKLATPDVSMADLIGDLDPIKAATQRLSYADEGVIHYGILPRSNRGIFAINELPDLQTRIQVGLLNILEEGDIQIRGFPVRMPLDLLLAFSANPEDYTNRGSIITPLKDRLDSQILTHYPKSLDDAVRITAQEAWTERGGPAAPVPELLRRLVEEVAFQARKSALVDRSSGVSARLSISALEAVVSAMERRAVTTGEPAYPRILDLQAMLPAVTGRIELVHEGEQEGVLAVAKRLVGEAVKARFQERFPKVHVRKARASGAAGKAAAAAPEPDGPYDPLTRWFAKDHAVLLTDDMGTAAYRKALGEVPGLEDFVVKHAKPASQEERFLLMEMVLEGMSQHSLISKEEDGVSTQYGDMLKQLLGGPEAEE